MTTRPATAIGIAPRFLSAPAAPAVVVSVVVVGVVVGVMEAMR